MKKNLITYLRLALRNRLNQAIKTNRGGSAVRDLGCTIPEFIIHISAQFHNGMNWGNWGDVWQLDHKLALADVDLTNREQFLAVCHFTNYQPLLIGDHRAKTQKEMTRRAGNRSPSTSTA